jgi:hypothetical protein
VGAHRHSAAAVWRRRPGRLEPHHVPGACAAAAA